eukprot:PhF_6_TR3713/c0_g1_i1/m.5307/K08488/STX7; syntaxin 7
MSVMEVERNITKLQNEIKVFDTTAQSLGTMKDSQAVRKKLERKRDDIKKIISTLDTAIKGVKSGGSTTPQFDKMVQQYNTMTKAYEQSDRQAKQKEREHVIAATNDASSPSHEEGSSGFNNGGGGGGGGGYQVQFTESKLKPYDLGELHTETAIQSEKAHEIMKLEQDLGELHSAYQEFNVLVKEQQTGLNQMEKNTDQSVVKVQSGVEELKQAGKYQKSARKKMCILLVILLIIIVIVVVVAVVMTKK